MNSRYRWEWPLAAVGFFFLIIWCPPLKAAFHTPAGFFAFVSIMYLIQAGQVLFTRTRIYDGALGENQRHRIDTLTRRFWTWFAVCWVGSAIIVLNDFTGRILAIFPMMVLEYCVAIPLRQAKNPEKDIPGAMPLDLRNRAASLAPRHCASPMPRWAWCLAWGMWACALVLVLADTYISSKRFLEDNEPLLLLTCAAGAFTITWLFLRWWLQSPEPMPEHASAELETAYEDLRSAKTFITLTMGWGFALAMIVFAVLDTLSPRSLGTFIPMFLLGAIVVPLIGSMGFHMARKRVVRLLRSAMDAERGV